MATYTVFHEVDAMKFDGVRPETIVIFEKAADHV